MVVSYERKADKLIDMGRPEYSGTLAFSSATPRDYVIQTRTAPHAE